MYRNEARRPGRVARLLLIPVLLTGLVGWTDPDPAPPHNIRMSLADMSVGATSVQVRIRFFWDDLQLGVMERTSNMDFRLAETDAVDQIILDYINDLLEVRVDGTLVQAALNARGIQDAARIDEVMWWYELEYPIAASAESIHLKNRLLFNLFEDQRNIVHLTTRAGKERAYYFAWDEPEITVPIN